MLCITASAVLKFTRWFIEEDEQLILTFSSDILIWAGLYQLVLKTKSRMVTISIFVYLVILLITYVLTFTLHELYMLLFIMIAVTIKSIIDIFVEVLSIQQIKK